jgi:O-succinylbenzoate synthase
MDSRHRLTALAVEGSDAVVAGELVRVRLALRGAHRAAHGTEHDRDVVLVGVHDAEGNQGWGECPTLSVAGYSTEDPDGAWQVLVGDLLPSLLGGTVRGPLAAGVPLDPRHPMASAAVEAAVVDLALRRHDESLAGALGADTSALARTVVLSALGTADGTADGDELVAMVDAAVAGGARMVKFKVSPATDLGALVALRRERPAVSIAVDANGSLVGANEVVAGLAGLGLAYVEQPAPPRSTHAAALRSALGVPVALDESAVSPEALEAALAAGEGDIVNVKPARLGGIAAALRCVEVARSHGARVFVGGLLETGVGRAVAAALAAGIVAGNPGETLPCDLGPSSQYFDDDVTDPVVVDGAGDLVVPTGPGIGVVPRADRLGAVTVARVEVSR